MPPLAPEYLAEIGRQLAGLSAFLGGFAAAFLGTMLTLSSARRVVGWAAGGAAVAAAAFAVAVVAATSLAIALHPLAPAGAASRRADTAAARGIAGVSFMLGMYALLVTLALSGWVRSRRLGLVTTVAASLAALAATWAIASF
jgi:hypothetical protein